MKSRLFFTPPRLATMKTPLLSHYTKNYGTLKEHTPLLLDELHACIQLLEEAKTHSPYAQPQLQRDYRRYAILFINLTLLSLTGTAGMISSMLFLMRVAHEKLVPELQNQLQAIFDRINAIDNEIKTTNELLKPLEEESNKYSGILDSMFNDITSLFQRWWQSSNLREYSFYSQKNTAHPNINNCVEWVDDKMERKRLIDLFPQLSEQIGGWGSWVKHGCWFESHNATHPLDWCNPIAKDVCKNLTETYRLMEDVVSPLDAKIWNLISKNRSLDKEKKNCSITQSEITSRINNPYSEPDPMSATILGVVAFIFLVSTTYYAYRLYKSRETHNQDLESSGHTIKRFLSITDSMQSERIAKLSLKLGLPTQEDMTIDFLLTRFKKHARELEEKRKQRMAFFAGVKMENMEAGNHFFLKDKASRDITEIIFENAELMPANNLKRRTK